MKRLFDVHLYIPVALNKRNIHSDQTRKREGDRIKKPIKVLRFISYLYISIKEIKQNKIRQKLYRKHIFKNMFLSKFQRIPKEKKICRKRLYIALYTHCIYQIRRSSNTARPSCYSALWTFMSNFAATAAVLLHKSLTPPSLCLQRESLWPNKEKPDPMKDNSTREIYTVSANKNFVGGLV